ncbi:MAG: M42 family peptidase, partial [Candidatus Omnitrophica bacterium]|nr:M42 family peptidase [Candidatus Omnitrophota bacterium]
VISRGPNINPKVFELLVAAAQAENIPFQIQALPRASGTDANVMQLNRAGVATALIGLPLRYMHTPVEIISLQDAENAARLLKAFIVRLDGRTSFIPGNS